MKTFFATAFTIASLLIYCPAIVATPCADLTFTNSVNIQGPDQFQTGLAFADFNNDGNLDAIFPNDHNATMSLSLGDGNGGFSTTTDFTVYDHPWGAAAADFDNDGNMDFAASSPAAGYVVVRHGDGAGGFGPLTAYYAGGSWNDFVATADFNGDGNIDIISPSNGGHVVAILLNDGTGTFNVSYVPVSGGSLGVTVGDFNLDGNTDFATANYDAVGTISVRLGNGSGGFSAAPDLAAGSFTWGVAVGNFNGDGFVDLAATSRDTDSVLIFAGDGAGNFALVSTATAPSHPMGIAVADLNGDGKDDVIPVSNDSNELRLFLGDGAGNLSPLPPLYVDYNSNVVAIADLNADGAIDFGTSGNGGFNNQIRIFINGCVPPSDTIAPTSSAIISPAPNLNGWNKTDVNVSMSAVDNDGGSGVANIIYSASGAQSIGMTTVSGSAANVNITAEGITTVMYYSTDVAGNVEPGKTVTVRIDKTDPVISITQPTNGGYLLNQSVTIGFACSDSGSGIASCSGTSANGSALDTSTPGSHTFTVTATDVAGTSTQQVVTYTVGYAIVALYDQTKAHKSGSTVPVKIRLVDANGNNVSSASTVVHAISVVQTSTMASTVLDDAGSANPDFDFRYDASLGGYVFNLKTTGYGTGSYVLNFMIGESATVYSVGFQVRQ